MIYSLGNDIYVHSSRHEIEVSSTTPRIVGWDVSKGHEHKIAKELPHEAVGPLIDALTQPGLREGFRYKGLEDYRQRHRPPTPVDDDTPSRVQSLPFGSGC